MIIKRIKHVNEIDWEVLIKHQKDAIWVSSCHIKYGQDLFTLREFKLNQEESAKHYAEQLAGLIDQTKE